MTTTMRFGGHYNRSLEKTHKYTHLHNKLKQQSKLFKKKYEIERSLEQKENEAREFCNIFTGIRDENKCMHLFEDNCSDLFEDRCMHLFEDIEHLEQKLKQVKKKLY